MSGADTFEIVGRNIHLPFLPKPFDGKTLLARVRAILAAPVRAPMDVTRVLSDLRSEREDIERAILSLERLDRPSAQTTDAAAQSATGIRVVKAPNES